MKTHPNFLLQKIEEDYYLLPFGQAIAEQRRGLHLNETGVFLWNHLEDVSSAEELACLLAENYDAAPEEIALLKEDVQAFLDALRDWGILVSDLPVKREPFAKMLRIAGLNLRLEGDPDLLSASFDAFSVSCEETGSADMTVTVHTARPLAHQTGEILVHNEQLLVADCGDFFDILFLKNQSAGELFLAKDGSYARIFCTQSDRNTMREEVFHAIRIPFLYLASRHRMAALHSASVLYEGKAWLFTGRSGIGKSTHTSHWSTLFETPILNGDLNLIDVSAGEPVVHGIPWCGTSGMFTTASHPLGGIVMLHRAPKDYVTESSPAERTLFINQRLISPSWTRELFAANMKLTQALVPSILFADLHCTANPHAAGVMKEWIDAHR